MYATPPKVYTGQIPVEGQLNVWMDDVIYLHGQATKPWPFGAWGQGTAHKDQSERVFATFSGVNKVNNDILDIRGKVENERGADTSVIIKAYMLCRTGTGRDVPSEWPDGGELISTWTQSGNGTTNINFTVDMDTLTDRPDTNEFYQVVFTYDTSDGGGGLLSDAWIHTCMERPSSEAPAYVLLPSYLDTEVKTQQDFNKIPTDIIELKELSDVPMIPFPSKYLDRKNTEVFAWSYYRAGCDELRCVIKVGRTMEGSTHSAQVKVYVVETDDTETRVDSDEFLVDANKPDTTFVEDLDISGIGLTNNTRFGVRAEISGSAETRFAEVYFIGTTGEGPAGYTDHPGEVVAPDYIYGDTVGEDTRLELLAADIEALAGDSGSGFDRSASPLAYRNYLMTQPEPNRAEWIVPMGVEVIRYKGSGLTAYWGNRDDPDSISLEDVGGFGTKRFYLTDARSLVAGMSLWIEADDDGELVFAYLGAT